MLSLSKTVVVAAFAFLLPLTANAVTVSFAGPTGSGTPTSRVFSEGGLDVTVTGIEEGFVAGIGQDTGGIGVNGVTINSDNLVSDLEILILTFSEAVSLDSVTFSDAGGDNDFFRIFVDPANPGAPPAPGTTADAQGATAGLPVGVAADHRIASLALTGTVFQITNGGVSSSNTFSLLNANFTAIIPLPAPILMLLAGLGLLGGVSRLRKA
ncbi:MAG: hypothetical protein AAGC79_08665 [Pseudomonadota bacterium]